MITMKIKYLFGAVCALALGLSSCSETKDDNPVLIGHQGEITANFLNIPQMQSAPVLINAENQSSNFNLTCSQPDFGYAAAAAYQVQVSKTEDFAEYREIKQRFYNCAQINPLYGDVAAAIEYLNNVQLESDLPLPYNTYYFRLKAFIPQSPDNTVFISNPVKFDNIAVGAGFLNIWVANMPANLWLRGEVNGWFNPVFDDKTTKAADYQFVTGKDEDTWVYETKSIDGVWYEITAGSKFKVADSTWGAVNLGGEAEDVKLPVNTSVLLKNASDSKDLTVEKTFKGTMTVTLKDGNYYILLTPSN